MTCLYDQVPQEWKGRRLEWEREFSKGWRALMNGQTFTNPTYPFQLGYQAADCKREDARQVQQDAQVAA